MAADSRVSSDGIAVNQAAPKIHGYAPDSDDRPTILVGSAGDGAAERVIDLVDWTRGDWAAEIAKHRSDLGIEADCQLLIGRAGRLWYYEAGCCYESAERYAATGSGCLVCLGYLAATPGVPPQERVRGAVRAAIMHVPSCGGKVRVHTV